jgi:hypothetical protein
MLAKDTKLSNICVFPALKFIGIVIQIGHFIVIHQNTGVFILVESTVLTTTAKARQANVFDKVWD